MTTDTKITVVKIRTPDDVVKAIPLYLGFHPQESLVLINLHGPRNRNGLTLRVDLPDRSRHAELVDILVSTSTRQEADGVVVACFTEDEDDTDGPLPRRDLVDSLLGKLTEHDVYFVHALLVRGNKWWFYDVGDQAGSTEGTELSAQAGTEITTLEADNVLHGRAVFRSRQEVAASIKGPVGARAFAMDESLKQEASSYAREVEHDGWTAAASRTVALARRMRDDFFAGHREIDDLEAARILIGLTDKRARDALMTWGLDDDGHDIDDVQDLIAYLTALANRSPGEFAAPICTVLAAVAYHSGNGALAIAAIERALASDPSYWLAGALDRGMQGQVHPNKIRAWLADARRDLPLK